MRMDEGWERARGDEEIFGPLEPSDRSQMEVAANLSHPMTNTASAPNNGGIAPDEIALMTSRYGKRDI